MPPAVIAAGIGAAGAVGGAALASRGQSKATQVQADATKYATDANERATNEALGFEREKEATRRAEYEARVGQQKALMDWYSGMWDQREAARQALVRRYGGGGMLGASAGSLGSFGRGGIDDLVHRGKPADLGRDLKPIPNADPNAPMDIQLLDAEERNRGLSLGSLGDWTDWRRYY